MIVYLIKANLVLALCAGAYAGISRRDTHLAWRRAALLVLLAASFVLPLAETGPAWPWGAAAAGGAADGWPLASWQLPEVVVAAAGPGVAEGTAAALRIAGMAYAAVAAALLLRLAGRTAALLLTLRRCRPAVVDGVRVRLLERGAAPFSFFRLIALPPALATDSRRGEVLAHEAAHARQWHSLDVVAAEVACALCWANPFAWFLRREVRANLEYLADRAVLRQGFPRKAYQLLLLEQALPPKAAALQNNFYVLLKKRIQMMNKSQSRSTGRAKYLLFLPFLAFVALGSMSLTAGTAGQAAAVRTETAARTADDGNDKVYDKADVAPAFPGGQAALAKFVSENMKYPAAALENNVEGRVLVQFTVGTDGAVEQAKVKRSADPALDKEALRVVRSMPRWTPGKIDGKPVRVRMVLPIVFRLA